ncbi:hypothetical protein DSO57_1001181 [Entomophthora muscae]|uniref:Uncharacterized protein n=1 Tax=Entomophthora muscae TaxID=34485 RepID=A0ACC2TWV6_9FUNG|nr:hypothetical protein DSO57_1001181 [Entomophthora muscae]
MEELQAQLTEQAALVRNLKAQKVDKSKIEEQVAKLLELKGKISALGGDSGSNKKGKQVQFTLKTPKVHSYNFDSYWSWG